MPEAQCVSVAHSESDILVVRRTTRRIPGVRWSIEILFRTLKSAMPHRARRFEHIDRLLPCLGLYLIVAWRTKYVCCMAELCPDIDCEAIFEPSEWTETRTHLRTGKRGTHLVSSGVLNASRAPGLRPPLVSVPSLFPSSRDWGASAVRYPGGGRRPLLTVGPKTERFLASPASRISPRFLDIAPIAVTT